MNRVIHTSALVFYRKEHGMTQLDVARAMATSQPAIARLEKRLLEGADVSVSVLERYAAAVGLAIEWTLKPVNSRYGIYPSAEAAIAAAVFSSACEGLATPSNEIENLRKVALGEISGEDLVKHYMLKPLQNRRSGIVSNKCV